MSYVELQRNHAELNIDLGTRCNLRCRYCQRHPLHDPSNVNVKNKIISKMRDSTDISLDSLRKIFDFGSAIALCGTISDPILHPKFLEILDMIHEYPNIRFRIATAANGPSLEWYEEAFKRTPKNARWVFGIDGLTDTSMIYREGQNSQLVWDAMMLGHNMKVDVSWQYIVFDWNLHQVEEAKRIAKENRMRLVILDSNRTDQDKVETRTLFNYRDDEFLIAED